jgi:NaMN:DMB phosphoribosyltransferase
VYVGDGTIDDAAWITRCLAIRDTLHRIKPRIADGRHVLAAVGGPALALATGLILGAADRRTPVMIDGPVGAAAALAARDFATEVRLWLLLADDGDHPAVQTAADLLGLTPAFRLGVGLGEGATSLAVLPLIQSALALSAMD